MNVAYWIWLSQLPGVGPISQKRLLDTFGYPEKIYNASKEELRAVAGVKKNIVEKTTEFKIDQIDKIVTEVEKLDVQIVTCDDSRFRDVFSCKKSPILFYYYGNLPKKRGIAIVGARRCTDEAKRIAVEASTFISQHNIGVISGLAKGVDSYAHTASVKVGGYTMAILAGGVNICYPKEHQSLYDKILTSGGAILSAYPPNTRPHPKYFLERNAHISAWSTDVIVVQASEKSGSLTTANFAIEQNRNLFAVPHSIFIKEAKGSNKLLAQGAKIYLGPESLQLSNCKKDGATQLVSQLLTLEEQKIVEFLKLNGTSTIQELSRKFQQPELEITSILLEIEMKKLVQIRGTVVTFL